MTIVNLLVRANGFYTRWDIEDTDRYTSVDDPVGNPDEDATYIYEPASDQESSFLFDAISLPSATINKLTIIVRAKNTDIEELELFYREASTDYINISSLIPTPTYVNYSWEYTENPRTSSAWTPAEVDAIEFGIISIVPSKQQAIRVTQIYVVVDYTVAVAPSVTDGKIIQIAVIRKS